MKKNMVFFGGSAILSIWNVKFYSFYTVSPFSLFLTTQNCAYNKIFSSAVKQLFRQEHSKETGPFFCYSFSFLSNL